MLIIIKCESFFEEHWVYLVTDDKLGAVSIYGDVYISVQGW